MPTAATDQELIQATLDGDTRSFALLVDRYKSFVFTLALRYAPGREDAEEIAQDAFIKAFRSLQGFRGDSRFSTWLYTIVTSCCLSFLRRKKLPVHSLDNEAVLSRAENLQLTSGHGPGDQKSRNLLVNQAIRLLAPDDAQILTLFYKGEQSLEEIAAILGIATGAVKVRLHRARGRLKEKMETHFRVELKDILN